MQKIHDYDEYVNGKWRSSISIPPASGSYSVSDEVEDKLAVALRNICRAARAGATHASRLVGTMYTSGISSRSQHRNVEYVRTLLHRIDCLRDVDDVVKIAVENIKAGLISPFQIVIAPDPMHTDIYKIHLTEGDTAINNLDLYATPKSAIMRQYAAYLKKVGKLLNVPNLHEIIPMEATLALALVADDDYGDPSKRVHYMTPLELQDNYKHIPWHTLWRALDLVTPPQFVLLPCPRYYAAIDRMFREFTPQQWQLLIKSQIIASLIKYLPPPFDELHYGFFGRALRGDAKKMPQEKLVLETIRQALPDALGYLYIKHIGTARAAVIKRDVTSMFELLRKSMSKHIESNIWMSPKTKEHAQAKIAAMYGKIAYPTYWKQYGGLELHPQEFVKNIVACNQWLWRYTWEKVNGVVNKAEWMNGALEVNAYYYPEENAVVIPIGILLPPFYDVKQTLAWNLGGIGCVIGHEICHGFDNEGKEFGADGSIQSWWSAGDHRHYMRVAHELEAVLDHTPHAGGFVNGSMTLAEAIADLTGARIALNVLLDKTHNMETIREFFVSFAVSWRKKERHKYAVQTLATDVHPPANVRVNLVVQQMPEWYQAYGLTPGEMLPLVI